MHSEDYKCLQILSLKAVLNFVFGNCIQTQKYSVTNNTNNRFIRWSNKQLITLC